MCMLENPNIRDRGASVINHFTQQDDLLSLDTTTSTDRVCLLYHVSSRRAVHWVGPPKLT